MWKVLSHWVINHRCRAVFTAAVLWVCVHHPDSGTVNLEQAAELLWRFITADKLQTLLSKNSNGVHVDPACAAALYWCAKKIRRRRAGAEMLQKAPMRRQKIHDSKVLHVRILSLCALCRHCCGTLLRDIAWSVPCCRGRRLPPGAPSPPHSPPRWRLTHPPPGSSRPPALSSPLPSWTVNRGWK